MFKGIARMACVYMVAFYPLLAQASPIGFYGKISPSLYWGEKSTKKESIAAGPGIAYQFNRNLIVEGHWPLWTTIQDKQFASGGEDIRHALTLIIKQVAPLKYYLNFYYQWGGSWKTQLGIHAPFFGFGMAYYHTRKVHFDLSWKHYGLLQKLRAGSPESRQNSIVFSVGYYIR